jgi:hypothetical protein
MNIPAEDPIIGIAGSLNAVMADFGYAFVEEDRVPALAEVLAAFLAAEGLSVDPAAAAERLARVAQVGG